MGNAAEKQHTLVIPVREDRAEVKARPHAGNRDQQMKNADRVLFALHSDAYRELAKV